MNPMVKRIWQSITCNGCQRAMIRSRFSSQSGHRTTRGHRTTFPAADYEMFRDVDFPLPPNYRDENDPYGDTWAIMSPAAERAALPEWMRVYYAMTANLDRNVGRLLQAVDDLGLRDDTIFVFTSDHGEMFGAQGRRAKNIFYEEAVCVPFLVRWQGQIPKGHVSDACLNTPDIMPTLLSMMDLPIPEAVEGDGSQRRCV